MFNKIMAASKQMFNAIRIKAHDHSPEIALGVGLVGMGATVVLACKATLKADKIMDAHAERMRLAHEAQKVALPEDNYDIREEKVAIWRETVKDLVREYWLPVTLGAFSVASILYSNNTLKKRYLGAVAAYNGLKTLFDTYRGRVREDQGKSKDIEYLTGVKQKEITVTETDENGKKVKSKKTVVDPDSIVVDSDYVRIFDSSVPEWDKYDHYNQTRIAATQQFANDLLISRGEVYLNEVLNHLGLPISQNGAVLGWRKKENSNGNKINFRVNRFERENGEPFYTIEFNCDGLIVDVYSLAESGKLPKLVA